MADARPSLHHVVFCVERAHQDDAATFWKELGFEFAMPITFIATDLPA